MFSTDEVDSRHGSPQRRDDTPLEFEILGVSTPLQNGDADDIPDRHQFRDHPKTPYELRHHEDEGQRTE